MWLFCGGTSSCKIGGGSTGFRSGECVLEPRTINEEHIIYYCTFVFTENDFSAVRLLPNRKSERRRGRSGLRSGRVPHVGTSFLLQDGGLRQSRGRGCGHRRGRCHHGQSLHLGWRRLARSELRGRRLYGVVLGCPRLGRRIAAISMARIMTASHG